MKRMFRTEPIDLGICPRRNPDINGLPSVWSLVAPALYEEKSCIQVDRKYIVSLGAHFTHANALLSKAHRINYFTAVEICNYLSFLFDTAIDVGLSLKDRDAKAAFRGLSRYFRLKGFPVSDVKDVQRLIAEPKALVATCEDDWQRLFPVEPRNNGQVLAFDLPKNPRLKNALVAYREALLSVDPVGHVLNYWRVLEATSNTKAKRTALLHDLFSSRLQGVLCIEWKREGAQHFNLMARYKRLVRPHYRRLKQLHGTNESIINFFYKSRRNPSAHANTDVLRANATTELRDLYYDALLLKLLARLSVQRFFDSVTT